MWFQYAPKLFEITLAFRQDSMRVGERHFVEANPVTCAQLRRDSKIDSDHVGDFRVTANGLAIIEQENRLTTRRYLHGSRRDRFR